VTRRSSVVMLAKGGVASGKGKGPHNASWADMNLTRIKNEENSRSQFNCYKWMVIFKAMMS
jgi:hypothetical protein